MKILDVIVIGAGAAGLICAIEAGKRQKKVLVLDHANKAGKKILMSGGGRCNFTNYHVSSRNFISRHPNFCESALARYKPTDFIQLIRKHHIPFHEKAHGQLFCDNKSSDIVDMLLSECKKFHVNLSLNTHIVEVTKKSNHNFHIKTNKGEFFCRSLVIASGGLSIPTMGASPFGYKMAEQFGLSVWPTRAGLVPLTLHVEEKETLSELSGVSITCEVSHHDFRKQAFQSVSEKSIAFRENLLFTHRGLSGPAILQISSYWQPGETVMIDLLLETDIFMLLKKSRNPEQHLKTLLAHHLPKRVVEILFKQYAWDRPIKDFSPQDFSDINTVLKQFKIKPNGTEGYRTAEVTLGGVDCDAISPQTMEVKDVPGLYFIGEVLDVSGWLGGFNFQWAWSSGWVAGQVV